MHPHNIYALRLNDGWTDVHYIGSMPLSQGGGITELWVEEGVR